MKFIFKITVVMIATMVLLQSMSFLVMNAEFNLNHSFIASSLCVNRDKPVMHCNGKCFLKKQLDQQQDQQTNNHKTIQQIISVAFQIENEIHPVYFPEMITVQSSAFNMQLQKGFLKSCERPPTC